jgi:prophage regulatory protein
MLAKTERRLNHLRFITKKELRLIVPYTPQQVLRLEDEGKFPKRFRLGKNRVAWVLDEIGQWLRARLVERGGPYPGAFDTLDDLSKLRIITKKELGPLVGYTPQHIQRLEDEGVFPMRIKFGANRVGWILTEVEEWLRKRMGERDGKLKGPSKPPSEKLEEERL